MRGEGARLPGDPTFMQTAAHLWLLALILKRSLHRDGPESVILSDHLGTDLRFPAGFHR